jgi:hypothetical protein
MGDKSIMVFCNVRQEYNNYMYSLTKKKEAEDVDRGHG